MNRTVTLTDEEGTSLGEADLLQAHSGAGMLHKAFSVYVFNPGRSSLLIQQRAESKMLFSLLWANTCCSHPFPNEAPTAAGERRLQEELGFSVPLTVGPSFVYRAQDPLGRGTEHEYVTTLIGTAEESVILTPDPKEVAETKWINLATLSTHMHARPERYALWLHLGLPRVLASLSSS